MADQHIGYPGSVNASQLASWMPNVAAAQYSVEGLFDGQVVTNNVGDRGVTVKPGTIIGDGIMDVFTGNTNLNFGSVASGSPDRWDMVVLRRTWNATVGASTSIYTIIPGGPNKTLPARNNNKGVLSDQPMALCRIKAGSTAVQEIIDLRCWASNGGVVAVHELVMTYLDQVGTSVIINGKEWCKIVSSDSSSTYWALRDDQTIVQEGFVFLGPTNSAGDGSYNFSTPFPNGVKSIQITDYNRIYSFLGVVTIKIIEGSVTKTGFKFRAYRNDGTVVNNAGNLHVSMTARGW